MRDRCHTCNHCVDNMLACMQATTAPASGKRTLGGAQGRDQLTRDMYALIGHVMRMSNVETFDMIGELDLSFTQIKALCALDAEHKDRSVKGLAESMQVSLPGM